MKGMKKVLVGFLASVSVFAGSLGLAGCEFSSSSSDDSKHLQQLYSQYVVYVKVMGQEPLVYKEWLTMIKENANVEIEKVEIDEDGNLVITYTDGTTQTLEVPKEEHIHSFGDWVLSATGGEFCEDKLYFRTCADCGDIEWKQGSQADHDWTVITTAPTCKEQGFDTKTCETCGKVEKENYTDIVDHDWTVVTTDPTCQEQGFDTKTCETCGKVEKGNYKPASHAWATTYSSDNSYHWLDCKNCDEIKDKQEHTIGVSGECSVCHEVFSVMEGVLYEVSVDGTYAEVIGYAGAAEKVLIAETYNGVPVTAIAERAFYNCTNITSIVVPNSVTSIGYEALRGCTSLTEVTLPFVGGSASDDNRFVHIFGHSDEFDDYDNYTYDYTPNSLKEVTITGGEISDWAFAWCIAQTVILGDGVTSIGNYAFYCSFVENVKISAGITTIEWWSFWGCYLTSIVIPKSVASIENEAFWGNVTNVYYQGTASDWAEISIGHTNTDLTNATRYYYSEEAPTEEGDWWHYDQNGEVVVWEEIVVSEGLEYTLLGNDTYAVSGIGDCTDTDIVIPATYNGKAVTSIGEDAFCECYSLTSVVIPDSVTSIGDYAFYECNSLSRILISDSVTAIGYNAFSGCRSLTSIEIPDTVTSIGGSAFISCHSLTSIVIPDSVTCIDAGVFRWCSNLTSVIIPDSVTAIGSGAFYECIRLKSIVVPDSVTSIGDEAFYYCTSLQFNEYGNVKYLPSKTNIYFALVETTNRNCSTFAIHNSTKLIADRVFSHCDNLVSIKIPSSVTFIGYEAFYSCSNLTNINVDENNTKYKDIDGNLYTKDGKELIQYAVGKTATSFTILDSVTSIGGSAFQYCDNLTNVVIHDNVTSIGDFAFFYCTNLTSIVIGKSVTSIGYMTFVGCDGLTNIVIPDSVITIGGWAFNDCDGLRSITFRGTKAQWNAIEKGIYWNDNVPATKVVCSDGEVAL